MNYYETENAHIKQEIIAQNIRPRRLRFSGVQSGEPKLKGLIKACVIMPIYE